MSDKDRGSFAFLPCPFCGESEQLRITGGSASCSVVCQCCLASGGESDSIIDAVKAWNTRNHYAPKLTENEAIDLIQKAMFEEKHTRGYSGTAIDALKAAGVRFKESGGVGT